MHTIPDPDGLIVTGKVVIAYSNSSHIAGSNRAVFGYAQAVSAVGNRIVTDGQIGCPAAVADDDTT